MTILVAPNAFKGSLTAGQAAQAMARGIVRAVPDAEIHLLPVADGGDGLLSALAPRLSCQIRTARVSDPLGRQVDARFGISGELAVVEMAEASGLIRLSATERNPMLTSSRGTGELILAAVRGGAKRLLLGIGGSATNDGGMGMAAALGVRFLDGSGKDLSPVGASLGKVARIDRDGLAASLRDLHIDVMCDVDNPLLGPSGASRVFGPQKGARPADVEALEAGMERFGALLDELGGVVSTQPGAGAAGGLGAALIALLGAHLRPGAEAVLDALDFDSALRGADLVLTGEGRLDRQSQRGKAPWAVATRARIQGIPCWAIAGVIEEGDWWRGVFSAVTEITPAGTPLETAIAEAAVNLEEATRALFSDQAGRV